MHTVLQVSQRRVGRSGKQLVEGGPHCCRAVRRRRSSSSVSFSLVTSIVLTIMAGALSSAGSCTSALRLQLHGMGKVPAKTRRLTTCSRSLNMSLTEAKRLPRHHRKQAAEVSGSPEAQGLQGCTSPDRPEHAIKMR